MKSINKIITLMLLMIMVAISQATKHHHISHKPAATAPKSPSPTPIRTHETSLSHQYIEFLQSCLAKISVDHCAHEIYSDIFNNTITDNRCCKILVDMGPDCHTALIERQTVLIKSKKRNRIVSRSEDLWRRCERVAPPPKTGDYPRLPPPRELAPGYDKFLEECAATVTDKCGREIVGVITDKNKDVRAVGTDCCLKLLIMGNECHVELAKGLQNLAKPKDDKKYIKDKAHDLWVYCLLTID